MAKASEGVRVRLIYDWMGGFGKTSRGFWNRLRAGGVEVRCYNPPRLDSPLGESAVTTAKCSRSILKLVSSQACASGACVLSSRERCLSRGATQALKCAARLGEYRRRVRSSLGDDR
ncbi:MAG: hypothetical protein WKF84_26750 [Pyrinomonadaceae bacterium]